MANTDAVQEVALQLQEHLTMLDDDLDAVFGEFARVMVEEWLAYGGAVQRVTLLVRHETEDEPAVRITVSRAQ